MDNLATIINAHNERILKPDNTPAATRECNCPKKSKDNCPLNGKCLIKNIIYKAIITPVNSQPKQYIGLTSTTFKERLGNHNHSFKSRSKSNATELSKFVWKLKDQNTDFSIKWSILQKASP